MSRIEYGKTPQATVVLWHGQYIADATDALATVRGRGGINLRYLAYSDPRIVGKPGEWRVIAETYIYEDDGHQAVES